MEENIDGGDKFPNQRAIRIIDHIECGGPKNASALKEAVAQTTTFRLGNLQRWRDITVLYRD